MLGVLQARARSGGSQRAAAFLTRPPHCNAMRRSGFRSPVLLARGTGGIASASHPRAATASGGWVWARRARAMGGGRVTLRAPLTLPE